MSWLEQHSLSEKYASEAELALQRGDVASGLDKYRLAAEAESGAIAELDVSKERTLGITVVSAAALFFKAREYKQAEIVTHSWLATEHLPDFAIEQLHEILQAIWNEVAIQTSGVEFKGTEVLVAVRGGEVVHGGAPLDIVATKVEQVSNLFYRTAEYLLGRPHRKRGLAAEDIREICRPWLFQTVAGSYQFAIRVQGPRQGSLFAEEASKSERVASKFLEIVQAGVEDPDGALLRSVPDPEYRATFLKLTRNLAPVENGSFDQLLIRPLLNQTGTIVIKPENRAEMNDVIRRSRPAKVEGIEKQLRGVLRALHLDDDWLELTVADQPSLQRVAGAGDALDDIVGPMVNRPVVVDVFQTPNGRYLFRDIQLAE